MSTSLFRNRLNTLLKINNMSQRELAKKLGISEVSVSRYINGSRVPRSQVTASMAQIFNVSVDYLLGTEQSEDDYQRTVRAITSNAGTWSPIQKANLVNLLFATENP